MKSWLFALFIVFYASASAYASDWYWHNVGNGYYIKVSTWGQNDGWYYTKDCTCGKYVKHSAIVKNTVAYGPNWKSDLLKALERTKDTELFLQAVSQAGLKATGVPVQEGSEYYEKGFSQRVSGYPYAEQGSTYYGLATYAPNIGQVDIQGTLETQSRLAEQLGGITAQANTQFSERVGQISSAQLEIAKIQEAGRAMSEAIRAAQPPTTTTNSYEKYGGDKMHLKAQNNGYSSHTIQPDALAIVQTEGIFKEACFKCHSGNKIEGNLDLTHFSTWSEDMRKSLGAKIKARVTSHDKTKVMPPADSGIEALTPDEISLVYKALP